MVILRHYWAGFRGWRPHQKWRAYSRMGGVYALSSKQWMSEIHFWALHRSKIIQSWPHLVPPSRGFQRPRITSPWGIWLPLSLKYKFCFITVVLVIVCVNFKACVIDSKLSFEHNQLEMNIKKISCIFVLSIFICKRKHRRGLFTSIFSVS